MEANKSPQIGKDVIESLTLGMYEECRFIYREYIQNSADQIDKAVAMGLLEKNEGIIDVQIDRSNRTITIEDNATGITKDKVVPILRNIAHSTKKRGVDKGFRGIGRLGGLGYCTKLTFETSYHGEDTCSRMVWDAQLLKNIINDREQVEEAVDVLERVTSTTFEKEDPDKHYFKVTMEGVTSEELLNEKSVQEYLSMVAPVDIASGFVFRSKINNFMSENGLTVDTYNIYINGDQIFKPYTTIIYEDKNGAKKKIDDIIDVDFLLQKDSDGNVIYWGWYTLSNLIGQMKPINIARGIRLRKENIQIGDEEICKKFFADTNDQRFSFYYFGEIHAVSKDLIPNSRRDYFGENDMCTTFEKRIKDDFLKLKKLCYDVQKVRSSVNVITKANKLREEIDIKDKNGYNSQQEKEDLQKQFQEHQIKENDARHKLENMGKKIAGDESSFMARIFQNLIAPINSVTESSQPKFFSQAPEERSNSYKTTMYRTDRPCYSQYTKREKRLIGRIYESIANAMADEKAREELISKIEEDLTR